MKHNTPVSTGHAPALLPAMIAISQVRDQACTSTSGQCPMALDSHRPAIHPGR